MATQKNILAPQAFNELYGVIIGLYGDPANREVSENGTTINDAYTYIGWSGKNDNLLAVLFWSRLLLVEILTPYDTNLSSARIALVARPRSLWLYQKNSVTVSDFVGNSTSPDTIGTSQDTAIVKVNPSYRLGDVIRIGTLPAPISLADFTDGFTRRLSSETYNGVTPRVYTVSNGYPFYVNAASYHSSYTNFTPTTVVYYDKNVDARTRIVGGAVEESGAQVDLPVCVGGVTSVYRLKGQRLA